MQTDCYGHRRKQLVGHAPFLYSPGLELTGAALEVSVQTFNGSSASSASFLAHIGEKIAIGVGSAADGNTTGDSSVATSLLWFPSGPHWSMSLADTCTLRANTATLCMGTGAWLNPLQIASWEHYLEQFSKANCPATWERHQEPGLSPKTMHISMSTSLDCRMRKLGRQKLISIKSLGHYINGLHLYFSFSVAWSVWWLDWKPSAASDTCLACGRDIWDQQLSSSHFASWPN